MILLIDVKKREEYLFQDVPDELAGVILKMLNREALAVHIQNKKKGKNKDIHYGGDYVSGNKTGLKTPSASMDTALQEWRRQKMTPKERIKNRPCNMAEREKHGTNKRDTGKKDR